MSDNPHDPVPFRPHVAGTQPDYDSPAYLSTRARHPKHQLVRVPHAVTEVNGPFFSSSLFPACADLSKVDGHEAVGERIIVAGTVVDEDGRPVPKTMIELWQANAAGRYSHERDQHDAPLDGKFRGAGRVFTDAGGRYRFTSIKPGAYPWRNHHNAWRPNHIHYSLFGPGFAARLVTQMYFPGDPLLSLDPIFNCVPDEAARNRLIAHFDLAIAQPEYALGYRFDIVLRGRGTTPFEDLPVMGKEQR
jgi:protocatechuate 3,4-dioxygenase, beta subunit